MRTLLLMIAAVAALALVRSIVRDIARAVSRAMGGGNRKSTAAASQAAEGPKSGFVGKLVRDPQTGTYIDPASAVAAEVDGATHYFESKKTRDEYLRARS